MKKFLALAVAVLMVLAMSTAVFAQNYNDGAATITIENPTPGKDYNLYKIFDATYSGNKASYTIAANNPWYGILTADGADFPANFDAVAGTSNPVVYRVTFTDDGTAARTWLINYFANTPAAQIPAANYSQNCGTNDTELVFENIQEGYYFITTNNGATVTATNAKVVTVIDKNQIPHWPEDGNGKAIVGPNGELLVENNVNIGDTVDFQIKFEATNYDGTTKVTQYVIHDTMEAGFSAPSNIVVSVGGTVLETTAYTIDNNPADHHTFDITIPWVDANGDSLYADNAEIIVTYSAVLESDAEIDTPNTNTANVTWNGGGHVDDDHTDTFTFDINIHKVNQSNQNLQGVTFQLSGANGLLYFEYDATNDRYILCQTEHTHPDAEAILTTDANGAIAVQGLAAGTYTLHEVATLAGYNPLTADVTIDIDEDGNVTVGNQNADPVVVVNTTGSTLPETGGIGTTIFYVVGGLMMAAAVVLLATRKKMSVED